MGNLLALAIAIGPAVYLYFKWSEEDEAVRRAMIRDNRSDLLKHVPGDGEKRKRAGIYAAAIVGGILVGALIWRR